RSQEPHQDAHQPPTVKRLEHVRLLEGLDMRAHPPPRDAGVAQEREPLRQPRQESEQEQGGGAVKRDPSKAPRNGAQEWNFTFDKGDLWIKTRRPPKKKTHMEMEAHALLPTLTQEEAVDLIAKTLIEKVGRDACAEGARDPPGSAGEALVADC